MLSYHWNGKNVTGIEDPIVAKPFEDREGELECKAFLPEAYTAVPLFSWFNQDGTRIEGSEGRKIVDTLGKSE